MAPFMASAMIRGAFLLLQLLPAHVIRLMRFATEKTTWAHAQPT